MHYALNLCTVVVKSASRELIETRKYVPYNQSSL